MIYLDCFPYITVWYVDLTTCPVGRFGTIGIYLEEICVRVAGGDLLRVQEQYHFLTGDSQNTGLKKLTLNKTNKYLLS